MLWAKQFLPFAAALAVLPGCERPAAKVEGKPGEMAAQSLAVEAMAAEGRPIALSGAVKKGSKYSVSYDVRGELKRPGFCFWVIEDSSGARYEQEVSNSLRRRPQGTLETSDLSKIRFVGAVKLYIEQGETGLNARRERVSNELTLE